MVSAGNMGSGPHTIAKPADDPWVISVGSVDDQGTASFADDVVSSFSSRGPTATDGIAKPDVAVPGRSLVSLRSPGSAVDAAYPYFVDNSYRRGSGTSFSAGIVSGAAAVLLAADPTMSNDRVKFELTSSGRSIPRRNGERCRCRRLRHRDGAHRSGRGGQPGSVPSDVRFGRRRRVVGLVGLELAGLELAAVLGRFELAGLELAGLQLARLELARLELAGLQLARLQLAGLQLAGLQLAGLQLARLQLARLQLARLQLARLQLARLQLAKRLLELAHE